MDTMEFECNYIKDDYDKVKALVGKSVSYAIFIGGTEQEGVLTPTGDDGKFYFDGDVSVFVKGGGVNEVIGMTVSIAATTVISETEPSSPKAAS